jgi:soluble lytic murein transglycosylase-like protein
MSAAAFWTARANLKDRRPAEVGNWLQKAAAQPRTFYGILASRLLGLPLAVRWAEPSKVEQGIRAVAATPAGLRALALLQLDENERAAGELLGLASGSRDELRFGIMTIAGKAGMPLLAVRLDGAFSAGREGFDSATYPLPGWSPEGGYRVDRALVYALIHQESRFNPKAKSAAGAAGLMQLMPATASLMARGGMRRADLFDPAVNIELGQRYIEVLLADQDVGGDLLRMAVAWNGGPGNLSKWMKGTNHQDDPLLFIEAITRRETRDFVEKLMTNFWIYRDRLGQVTASLDAIASGQWPGYDKQDERPETEVADDGRSIR